MAEARVMAKKASTKKTGPAPKGEPHRRVIASFKGTEQFEGWLDRLGKHVRMPVSTLIEHALVGLAKEHGFEEEPPER